MNVYMPLPFYLCLPLHSMFLFCTVAEDYKLNETYLRKLKFDGSSIKSFVVHRVNMRCARTAVTQSLKAFWANKHISKNNGREQR